MIVLLIVAIVLLVTTEIAFERIRVFRKKITRILKSDKCHKEMILLYGGREAGKEEEKYIEKKIRTVLLMLIIGAFLAVGCCINEGLNPKLQNGDTIRRPDFQQGSEEIKLYATGGPLNKKKMVVEVSDRVYERKQIASMAVEVKERIFEDILLDNTSVDNVNSNLNLMTKMDGYPFSISWKSEKPLILNKSGELNLENLKNKLKELGDGSIIIKLYAAIKYEDYYEELVIPINVTLPQETEETQFLENMKNSIRERDLENRESDRIILPNIVNGKNVQYEEEKSVTAALILMLSIAGAAGLFLGQDNDLEKRAMMRNDQVESDYPGIVNRYALYYCAGMHPKAIWREMCRDYRQRIAKGMERRYAYEAMLKSEAMMNDGRGDIDSLNEFAMECKLKKYRRLVNLIEQTLIKGRDEMSLALSAEAEEAVNEKLSRARIKGEEAGTRLLLPMFMMLSVVLVIVIVPAFINFKM